MGKDSSKNIAFDTESQHILLRVMQYVVDGCPAGADLARSIYDMDYTRWFRLATAACLHRIQALLWDALDPDLLLWERRVQLAWEVNKIEKDYDKLARLQEKVVSALESGGVECLPLKGVAVAGLYGHPRHRKFSDIDIYVPGGTDKACSILESQLGASVIKYPNHHDKAVVDGVSIELHRTLANLAKFRANRIFQKHMDALYAARDMHTFHYLFLVQHAALHFLESQLSIIHVADIAIYEKHYSSDIDWQRVETVARECGFDGFLTAVRSFLTDRDASGPEKVEMLLDSMHAEIGLRRNGSPVSRTMNLLHSYRLHKMVHSHESVLAIWLRTVLFWLRRKLFKNA